MNHTPSKIFGLLALIALFMPIFGCGGGTGEDIIYLHVVNGYAGGGSLSIYGPDGEIVQSLKFKETSGAVEFDRTNYQGDLSLALDGVPGLVPKSFNLYSLYPGEHATIFVQRRSDFTDIDVSLLRHNLLTYDTTGPSFSNCVFEVTNNMSLTNEFTDERYEFQTEWNFDEATYSTFYDQTREQVVTTECGPLNLNDIPGLGATILARRQQLFDQIDNSPWFFPVQSEEEGDGGLLTYVWGKNSGPGGQTLAFQTSTEFSNCVTETIEIESEMDAAMSSESSCDTTASGEQVVPRDMMGNPKVKIDQLALDKCFQPKLYSGFPVTPAAQQSHVFYYTRENACDQTIRLRTPFVDSIFDAPEQTGKLVRINVKMPKATWRHVVVYGRPINPLIYQFHGTREVIEGQTEPTAEDFEAYTYPNDAMTGRE